MARKKKAAQQAAEEAVENHEAQNAEVPDEGQQEQAAPKIIDGLSMDSEKQIRALIDRGKKKGFLTYEEMNDSLPEDVVSPSRLERILASLDE
ncbi:MAG TPA: hypothetical protein ENN81_10885, partial [Phycisphaerales bacterium]|nr:hypothetical protein [Phycisphaerales bacterium]